MSAEPRGKRPPPNLGPLEGGRWRPVRPEELLRREPREPAVETPPVVDLQRQQELERYLKPKPADLEAYLELAEIYRQQERPLQARRTLHKGLEVFPEDPELLWQHEEACLALSLQHLRQAMELEQRLGTAEAHRELERARTDWACRRVDVCRARLQREPDCVQLRVVLAEALKDQGLFEAAIEAAEAATQDESLGPVSFLIRGQCYQAMGEMFQALPMFRAAGLRRATPAAPRIRITALRAAMEIAQQLGLPASYRRYQRFLKIAEAEAKRQTTADSAADDSAADDSAAGDSDSTNLAANEPETRDLDLSKIVQQEKSV
ncbi:tetratricopeptide repeat protein [Roseimaritima sediminicola]|uniref:tetratricopeptide repeat protein n=1 Tax=Roseimaritima sediminicola TaxID=2662066 RepID=UPI00129835C9|nr:hypothetical protein [Roseimaritima sediminicola]